MPIEDTGVSAIVVRDRDGRLRAFLNACRHRATRLVDAPCQLESFVCPYHKWSYALSGELRGVPHPKAFASIDKREMGLVELPVAERHGFVWLTSSADGSADLDAYLGPLDAELDAFALSEHVVHQRFSCERRANWKLIMDAFLEAYHIKTLHADTLASFFMDARAIVEPAGRHFRGITARRRLPEARALSPDAWPIRELVTPSYLIFPNTNVICHPDYISVVAAFPLAPNRLRWVHWMLIPEAPKDEAARRHWDRTMNLIEHTVFQAEDLHVAELMQRGLETGANRDMLFGQLEFAVPLFHRNIEAALAM
jgi:phenylpropionate dioxygenase-like ring-hydroxylating dioxygenase large terminal subunit